MPADVHEDLNTPLDGMPDSVRDQQVAETLAFMAARGYDFVAPGEPATVVRQVNVTTDDRTGTSHVTLNDSPKTRTIEYSDAVKLDLGAAGQVVGVRIQHPQRRKRWRERLWDFLVGLFM